MNARRPRALQQGDRVAVVSPAGPVRSDEGLERGLARLRSWSLRPVLMPHAGEHLDYLAGADADRAADLQAALSDPEIRAVFATRGGYGCMRILDRLDLGVLRDDPKPIVGFSDLTALLAAVWRETGTIGLHGPMVAHGPELECGEENRLLQRQLLAVRTRPSELPDVAGAVPHALCPGAAEGRLLGGNLTMVAALAGTPWQIDTAGALLFLEETGEVAYRVDRLLTQLRLCGALANVAGVVLGDFHAPGQPLASESGEITRVLLDRLGDLGVPVAYGFPFGHRPDSWTLPFGARARLDARDPHAPARLELLEPAVG